MGILYGSWHKSSSVGKNDVALISTKVIMHNKK